MRSRHRLGSLDPGRLDEAEPKKTGDGSAARCRIWRCLSGRATKPCGETMWSNGGDPKGCCAQIAQCGPPWDACAAEAVAKRPSSSSSSSTVSSSLAVLDAVCWVLRRWIWHCCMPVKEPKLGSFWRRNQCQPLSLYKAPVDRAYEA